jgi:hypothetical protein
LKYGVVNLIAWFPVIWRDRQWDEYFLYALMVKKLQRMEKLHRKHGMCVDAHIYAKQMRVCIFLLKRLMADDYYRMPKSQAEAMEKYPGLMEYLNRKETRRERQDILEASRVEGYLMTQDLELLFKTMRKHVAKWWD